MTKSQSQKILDLLKTQGEATNIELNQICFRYAARIHDLRNRGHNITSMAAKGGVWKYVYNAS
jgi:hypothetical protein